MALPKVPTKPAAEIRKRLTDYVQAHHGGNWPRFAAKLDVPRSTVLGWRDGRSTPPTVHLLKLAERGVSLDWLLFNVGSMVRQEPAAGTRPGDQLHAALRSEYVASARVTVTADQVGYALPAPDVLFRLTVEFVRPFVNRFLKWILDDEATTQRYYEGADRDLEAEAAARNGFVPAKCLPPRSEAQTKKYWIPEHYRQTLDHMMSRHANARASYRFVNDEIALVFWHQGQEPWPLSRTERRDQEREVRMMKQGVDQLNAALKTK